MLTNGYPLPTSKMTPASRASVGQYQQLWGTPFCATVSSGGYERHFDPKNETINPDTTFTSSSDESTKPTTRRWSEKLSIKPFSWLKEKSINSLKAISVFFILIYRTFISGQTAPTCRFYPSCSAYGKEAFEKHPLHIAFWLTLRRVVRCHPGGAHGFDPVPQEYTS